MVTATAWAPCDSGASSAWSQAAAPAAVPSCSILVAIVSVSAGISPGAVICKPHNAPGKVLIIPGGGPWARGGEPAGGPAPAPLAARMGRSQLRSFPGPSWAGRIGEKFFSQRVRWFLSLPFTYKTQAQEIPSQQNISAACLETAGLELSGDLIFV